MTFPLCPKCGCPARIVILKNALVHCDLTNEGLIGRPIRAYMAKATIAQYKCGGAPICKPWDAPTLETDEDD
jgi:hypothetical protein